MRALIVLLAVLPLGLALPGAAWAEAHAVTVVNHAAGTIRSIQIAPAGTASSSSSARRTDFSFENIRSIGLRSGL